MRDRISLGGQEVLFDPDGGRLLISGVSNPGFRGEVRGTRVWDSCEADVDESKIKVAGPLAFRPDGTVLQLTIHPKNPSILRLWDVNHDQVVRDFPVSTTDKAQPDAIRSATVIVNELAMTPDGSLIAATVNGQEGRMLIQGRSKLVMQTHRAYVLAGEGFPYWMGLTAADRLMTSLPLFHINAPAYSMMGSLACGAGLILLPRFSASGFLDAARRHGATEFNAIGAMLEILMRQPPRPDDADTPLRLCYTGRPRRRSARRRWNAGSGCASWSATRCRRARTG